MSEINRRTFIQRTATVAAVAASGAVSSAVLAGDSHDPIIPLLKARQAVMDSFNAPGQGDLEDDDPRWTVANELEAQICELPVLSATGAWLAMQAFQAKDCNGSTDECLIAAVTDFLRRESEGGEHV